MGKRTAGIYAWLHLARFYSKIQRREMAHLAQFNLTLAQFDVLAQLSAHEGITQQKLANLLLVTKGNICGLVDRMSEMGLVERRSDPHDRRSNLLYVTAEGQRLAKVVIPAHSALLQELMNSLPAEDQYQLFRLLHRLDHSLS